mgnify:CR=1 FL=1
MPAWKRVALTRCIALGPALLVAVATTSTPGALNAVNEYLNILQSVQLPFALLPVLHFTSRPDLMGERWMNTMTVKVVCWVLALIVIVTNFYLTITTVARDTQPVWFYVLSAVLGRSLPR